MSSFEWMELQTLISDIATARSRLADARQRKDHGRIRALEDEISKAERLRLQLVAHITTNIVSEDPGPASKRKGKDGGAANAPAAAAEPEPDKKQPEPASTAAAEPADRIVARGPAPLASGPKAVSAEGGVIVWDQLTPDHIERAKRELATRRADMLSRHAEELKALEVEQIQLDGLEQAIQSFLQKFSKSDEAAVVQLEQGRGSRQ